jgi:hypothetical protein
MQQQYVAPAAPVVEYEYQTVEVRKPKITMQNQQVSVSMCANPHLAFILFLFVLQQLHMHIISSTY